MVVVLLDFNFQIVFQVLLFGVLENLLEPLLFFNLLLHFVLLVL